VELSTAPGHCPLDGPDARLDATLREHLRDDDGVALGLALEQRDGLDPRCAICWRSRGTA
jgi:hypothetical protein